MSALKYWLAAGSCELALGAATSASADSWFCSAYTTDGHLLISGVIDAEWDASNRLKETWESYLSSLDATVDWSSTVCTGWSSREQAENRWREMRARAPDHIWLQNWRPGRA